MGKTLRTVSVFVGILVLAACGGAGSNGPAGGGQPSDLTATAESDQPSPTATSEPIPLPSQVRSLVAQLSWDGFLEGEIDFDFDFENPGGAPFTIGCSSESTKAPVGQQVINAEGAGALAFRQDYLAELTHTPAEMVETFTCTPDNGLPALTFSFPVRGPDGLTRQFQGQPPISDRGLAFIVVHTDSEQQRLILEARLSTAGQQGSLDCSATPAGLPSTYLFGDVKEFSAEDATVRFQLPDVEASLSEIAPDADVEFLCNMFGPTDRTPRDSRTLTFTPPLP